MSAETQIKTGTSYWNQTVQAVWYQALISQRFKTCKLTLAIAKWKNPTVCRQTDKQYENLRDMRPSCQTDQVERGPCDAQSHEEKLRD